MFRPFCCVCSPSLQTVTLPYSSCDFLTRGSRNARSHCFCASSGLQSNHLRPRFLNLAHDGKQSGSMGYKNGLSGGVGLISFRYVVESPHCWKSCTSTSNLFLVLTIQFTSSQLVFSGVARGMRDTLKHSTPPTKQESALKKIASVGAPSESQQVRASGLSCPSLCLQLCKSAWSPRTISPSPQRCPARSGSLNGILCICRNCHRHG